MLDAVDDAVDAIEEFFENLSKIKIDFNTLISGEAQNFVIEIFDDETLEVTIIGTTTFKITDDNKLSTSFSFRYTEYEDDGTTIEEEFDVAASLILNLKPTIVSDINLKDIGDISVTVNGIEIWTDAFLDELY